MSSAAVVTLRPGLVDSVMGISGGVALRWGYGEYYNTTIPVGGHISWYWANHKPMGIRGEISGAFELVKR